jgi:glutamine synthetase adenylyltransferase
LIYEYRLEQIIEQISFLAEAICHGAYQWARCRLSGRWGTPLTFTGEETQFVILAMGKLGGTELNYSSDIDLVMVTLLSGNYRWLRKLEHRLQLMFDLQTHTLPKLDTEQQKIALRMGFTGSSALTEFKTELAATRESNRTILNHLLHSAFGMTFGSLRDSGGHLAFATDQEVPAEVDLILEPEPDPELIVTVLQRYGFKDVGQAFESLMDLATENTAFLSSRRCHHFLAAIAPSLLREIAATPDPDATLVTLANVSDSLGAKGVLWELFSFNPPTLNLTWPRRLARCEWRCSRTAANET